MFNVDFIKRLPENPNNHAIYDFKKKCYDENLNRLKSETKITFYALQNLGAGQRFALTRLEDFLKIIEKLKNMPPLCSISVGEVNFPEYDIEDLNLVSDAVTQIYESMCGVPFIAKKVFLNQSSKPYRCGKTPLDIILNPKSGVTENSDFLNTACLLSALPLCGAVQAALEIAKTKAVCDNDDLVKTTANIFKSILNAMGDNTNTDNYIELKRQLLEKLSDCKTLIGKPLFNTHVTYFENTVCEDIYSMDGAKDEIDAACNYLKDLRQITEFYQALIDNAVKEYQAAEKMCRYLVCSLKKNDWQNDYSKNEMAIMKKTVVLAGLIYKMCSIKLVTDSPDGLKQINVTEIENVVSEYMRVVKP